MLLIIIQSGMDLFMKISEHFNLNKTQFELDFIDIDTNKDTRLFLDPYFISKCEFPFASAAHDTLRSYFENLLALLRGNYLKEAEEVFSHLGETNDLCLGMSSGRPSGHGMGPEDTKKIFERLLESKALTTGVMEDIEDFRIFVPNVDKDKVSDMAANIIRKHLIEYTQNQCNLLGIPLQENVPSGMYWDSINLQWQNEYTQRLVINGVPILLVPKRVVSFSDKYTPGIYRQHFVLNFLKNEHLRLHSSLVRRRKNGNLYVTKKSVKANEPVMSKDYLIRFTQRHPEIFQDFKRSVKTQIRFVDGNVYDEINTKSVCETLTEELHSIPAGPDKASAYHQLMIGILEFLLYPNLSSPKKELEIHDGRKRIDISFNNSAETGFFFRLPSQSHITCPFVFIECKNYSREVANPELDQMGGRFSYQRGRFGIIVCRAIDDMDLFVRRCADTYSDDRGLIIPIVDTDIYQAFEHYTESGCNAFEEILERRYRQIITYS